MSDPRAVVEAIERSRRAARRAMIAASVSAGAAVFGLGWVLRGILDGLGH